MNKTDLINSIAAKSGLSKKNSEAALKCIYFFCTGRFKSR